MADLIIMYAPIVGALCVAALIAIGIVTYTERLQCDRIEGGYKCHGKNCEGCYRRIGGQVVFENPQPANQWGEGIVGDWGQQRGR